MNSTHKIAKAVGVLLIAGMITGVAAILCGSLLEILGFDLHLVHTIPGGL